MPQNNKIFRLFQKIPEEIEKLLYFKKIQNYTQKCEV